MGSPIRLFLFFLFISRFAFAETVFVNLYGARGLSSSDTVREAELEERDGKYLLKLKTPVTVQAEGDDPSSVDHILISRKTAGKLIETLAPLTTHRVFMRKTELYVPDEAARTAARASLVEVSRPSDGAKMFRLPNGDVLSAGMVEYFISAMTKPAEVELPWKVSYVILDGIDFTAASGGVAEFAQEPRIMTEMVVTPQGGTTYRGEGRSLSHGAEGLPKVLKFSQWELTDPVVQRKIQEYRSGQLAADKKREAVVAKMLRDEGIDGRGRWKPKVCERVNREAALGTP